MIDYYIIGQPANDLSGNTYWNSNIGWTGDFDMAHNFDNRILNYPLPIGSTGIMKIDSDNLAVKEFIAIDHNYDN
jgi:hypothetical protein